MLDGSKIGVPTFRVNGQLIGEVTDNGTGIANEVGRGCVRALLCDEEQGNETWPIREQRNH